MENSIPTTKYSNVRPDWAFFLYFTGMFCLYTHTIIQLLLQVFIIGYVLIKKLGLTGTTFRIKTNTIKNIFFLLIWFGALTVLLFLSTKFWAYSHITGSRTMMGVFRCFGIGLAMFLYIDTSEKALSVMQSFVYASAIMGVAALVTTPTSQYFQAGDDGFGVALGQQRNGIGAIAAGMSVVSVYLRRYTDFKYGNYLSVFFVLLTIITGSRGSLVQLLILFVLIVIIDKDLFKMMTKIIIFVIAAVIIILMLRNIPILYENIWLRFEDMFATITGEKIEDASTKGREFYKEIAFNMFLKKPFLGWGLDGFTCYLRDNPYYKGYYIEAVYSHCNFSELMADLGVVGLLVWYVPTASILIKSFKYREYHPLIKIMFFWLLSMIILDYARIPWMTHPSSYQYFLAFLIIIFLTNEAKIIKRNIKQNSENALETTEGHNNGQSS
ncbi:MAG: O-antigen ligase family protein [Eubacterium sp.]|nr:O-antigen ligase family protein [Eubacterium sp.]